MNKPSPALGVAEIGLLLVVAVWGVNFAIIKVPLEVIPPFAVNALRFTVSAVVLTGLHLWQSSRQGLSPLADLRRFPVAVIVLGLLAHVVYQTGFILGVDRVTAGVAALLISSNPIWTSVVGHLKGIDRLRAGGWIGLAIGIAGVGLVIAGQTSGREGGDVLGVLMMLVAAAAWGLSTVFSRPLFDRGATPLGLTVSGLWVAYPILLAMGLWEIGAVDWTLVGSPEWAAIGYSGALSTGVAYWIWYVAVKKVGPSLTAAFSNLVPFVGVGAGAVLLNESVQAIELVGGALIIAGLVVMRSSR